MSLKIRNCLELNFSQQKIGTKNFMPTFSWEKSMSRQFLNF